MTRIVVIGGGIAGITAALHATAGGSEVTLILKGRLGDGSTDRAQGGIAAVTFADDRFADHVRDTMTAGAAAGDLDAVRTLVCEAPARIDELVTAGVAFDRESDGSYVKGLEAAHSYPRVLHAGGDATGHEIQRALIARLRASAVEVLEHAFLADIAVSGGRSTGVQLLVSGAHRQVSADAVILATGGAGQLYAHTTNPAGSTGDGIAAALRAGAEVADLEFVQFHPTVLAAGSPFLISEAVRGEGAVLVDERGSRFAFDAHPDGELAPRDVVARAVARTMAQQCGRPALLDATALGASFLRRRFPTIDAAVRGRDLDWAREPVPVTPAAHYLMGGVRTDLSGRTSIPGLYAVGECARTGVHGANRLASNSLLEGAVFGARAGDAVAQDAASGQWPVTDAPTRAGAAAPLAPPRGSAPVAPARGAAPPFTRARLQRLMWTYAALTRDADGLGHAAGIIDAWLAQRGAPRTTTDREDQNLIELARALVAAASARPRSLGAHYRTDDEAFRTPPLSTSSARKPAESTPIDANRRSSERVLAETL